MTSNHANPTRDVIEKARAGFTVLTLEQDGAEVDQAGAAAF